MTSLSDVGESDVIIDTFEKIVRELEMLLQQNNSLAKETCKLILENDLDINLLFNYCGIDNKLEKNDEFLRKLQADKSKSTFKAEGGKNFTKRFNKKKKKN